MSSSEKSQAQPEGHGLAAIPPEFLPPEAGSPRARILSAAREAFAEKGLNATTTRVIAEGAAVNLAMVHYYFGSKVQLYRRVLGMEMLHVFRTLAGVLAEENARPIERFLNLVRRINAEFRDDPIRLAIIRHEMGQGAPHALDVVRELGDAGPKGFRQLLFDAMTQAQDAGQLAAVEPRAIANLLLMSAYGPLFLEPIVRVLFDAPSLDDERWEHLLTGQSELLRRALLPRTSKESKS
jgi:AcrR family transcriptional regulator